MPISLAQIKGNIRTINVTYFNDNLAVTYRPSELTPQNQSAINDRIEAGDAKNILIETLCQVMVSWDVVDEAGVMLPITPETLAGAPGPLLLAISEAIGEDARPKPKSAGKSFAR